ncbi:MAG: hypothetical protein IH586_10855 [Anaerolineaceae bacterium]|nr:hypothetical protein [Anaerolineaceae bacterium]
MAQDKFGLPPIFFNHLYLVLDDKTYRAIQASDFLCSAFSGREQRSTVTAAGETWSGTYYYCQDNYLEFFGESTGRHWRPGAQEGWGGLAFSTDQSGGVDKVRSLILEDFGYTPFYELRKLVVGEKKFNWFHYVSLAEQVGLESFDSWVMEYHPDIFQLKGISLPASGELSRRAYLSPWSPTDRSPASSEKQRHAPVFSHVIGATLNMSSSQADIYSSVLRKLGYTQKEEAGQILLSANGFKLRICLQPEEAIPLGYRISSLRLEMIRPSVAPITFVFAPGSRLILNDDLTADWFFGE